MKKRELREELAELEAENRRLKRENERLLAQAMRRSLIRVVPYPVGPFRSVFLAPSTGDPPYYGETGVS